MRSSCGGVVRRNEIFVAVIVRELQLLRGNKNEKARGFRNEFDEVCGEKDSSDCEFAIKLCRRVKVTLRRVRLQKDRERENFVAV